MTHTLILIIKGQIMAHNETLELIEKKCKTLRYDNEYDGGALYGLGEIEEKIELEIKRLTQALEVLEGETK